MNYENYKLPKNEIFFEIDLAKNPCSISLRRNKILDFSLIFIKHDIWPELKRWFATSLRRGPPNPKSWNRSSSGYKIFPDFSLGMHEDTYYIYIWNKSHPNLTSGSRDIIFLWNFRPNIRMPIWRSTCTDEV